MKFHKIQMAHGGGEAYVRSEHVAMVRPLSDNRCIIYVDGREFKVEGSYSDVVAELESDLYEEADPVHVGDGVGGEEAQPQTDAE